MEEVGEEFFFWARDYLGIFSGSDFVGDDEQKAKSEQMRTEIARIFFDMGDSFDFLFRAKQHPPILPKGEPYMFDEYDGEYDDELDDEYDSTGWDDNLFFDHMNEFD